MYVLDLYYKLYTDHTSICVCTFHGSGDIIVNTNDLRVKDGSLPGNLHLAKEPKNKKSE